MAYTAMQNVVAFSFLVMAAASFPPAGLNATGGQCTTASYEFCCNVGKACMCRLPKGSHGQCMHTSYDFCCDIGRPCDCSKGPHSGKLTCEVIKLACNKVFVKAATSIVGCTLEDATVVAACEIAGIGPEDPLADACAAILGTTVEVACVAAIKSGGKFTSQMCRKAAGCDSSETGTVVV
jgi:hypothetical protein